MNSFLSLRRLLAAMIPLVSISLRNLAFYVKGMLLEMGQNEGAFLRKQGMQHEE